MDPRRSLPLKQRPQHPHRTPRLDRRNAAKNIDYEAQQGVSDCESPLRTRSLDLPLPPSYNTNTSFRIDGEYENEVDIICRSLGLSGPEDFAIPAAAWEKRKERSSSDLLPRSRLLHSNDAGNDRDKDRNAYFACDVGVNDAGLDSRPRTVEEVRFTKGEEEERLASLSERITSRVRLIDGEADFPRRPQFSGRNVSAEERSGGIKGPRPPPVLKPPPAMSLLRVSDKQSTSWELLMSLAPEGSELNSRHRVADEVRPLKMEEERRASTTESFMSDVRARDTEDGMPRRSQFTMRTDADEAGGGGDGIRAPRPIPVLKPVRVLEKQKTFWDLFKSLASETEGEDDGDQSKGKPESYSPYLENDKAPEIVHDEDVSEWNDIEDGGLRLGVTSSGGDATGSSSFTTSNDDDSPCRVVEGTDIISLNSNNRFKYNIDGWIQGKELGRGSFGTVYEAISDDGFFFAVKEVSLVDQGSNAQQCIQQLEQEIALLSNFDHENIVRYLGTKKEEAKLYIFLELVTQGSLASLYQKYDLRESQVSAYTKQILNGLEYLHDRNVVHRDIKCANILVDASGSVKLADFGLAKETSKLNVLKSCKGSVYWMAPEVVKPGRPYGASADIWSLGCTVLEMLTRKLPYPDLEWTQALFKIGRGGKPDIPDSLSRDAHDFINQCIQVNPDDRATASILLLHPFVKRQFSSSGFSSVHSSHGRRA